MFEFGLCGQSCVDRREYGQMSIDSDTMCLFVDRSLAASKEKLMIDLAAFIGSSVMTYRAVTNPRENRNRKSGMKIEG